MGVAIARDATLRGLKVLLIEKEDFGSGASSKTSKLAHGGLRYLETLNFSLVRQSLRERNLLLKNAEGFVFPKRFLFPIFSNTKKPAWLIKIGLMLYDLFALGSPMPSHRSLSKDAVVKDYRFLKPSMLKSGFHYYDGTMRDSRLLIENMLSATEYGATCLNYTQVTEFLFKENKIIGVVYNQGEKAYAKAVVNATGSSADSIRKLEGESTVSVTGSKGIHLVLKRQFSEDAILLLSPIDERVFFLIPWEGMTLLGTTDTKIDPLQKPGVFDEDIDYLLNSANFYLNESLSTKDIASSFVGVRPLVRIEGRDTYSSSRNAQISVSKTGLITVIGGKYTTFRAIAEEVLDRITTLPCLTTSLPFSSSPEVQKKEALMAGVVASGLHVPLIHRLKKMWVHRASFVLEQILSRSDGLKALCPHHPFTIGELAYGILYEKVVTADDWQLRRTTSGYTGLCTEECTQCIDGVIKKIKSENDYADKALRNS